MLVMSWLLKEEDVCASWQSCMVHLGCLQSKCSSESSQEILAGALGPLHALLGARNHFCGRMPACPFLSFLDGDGLSLLFSSILASLVGSAEGDSPALPSSLLTGDLSLPTWPGILFAHGRGLGSPTSVTTALRGLFLFCLLVKGLFFSWKKTGWASLNSRVQAS